MSLRGMVVSFVVLLLVSQSSLASAAGNKHGRYPMPVAEYQHKIDERMLHARERMETRIVRRKLSNERAKEVRGRFEMSVIEVRKVMADAASDGVITREEARRVNQSTRGLNRAAARAR